MAVENYKFIALKLDDNASEYYANLTLYDDGSSWKVGEPNNSSHILRTKDGKWKAYLHNR